MTSTSDTLHAYLEKHGVEKQLNDVLNNLVANASTVNEPLAWMASKLEGMDHKVASAVETTPSETSPLWPQMKLDSTVSGAPSRWAYTLAFQVGPADAAVAAVAAPPAPAAEPAAAGLEASTQSKGGDKVADKEAKKAAKAEEKRKKEEEKERKRLEREEAERKKLAGPEVPRVTLHNFMEHEFGDLMIQSHCKTDRQFVTVAQLSPDMKGTGVWLRVRLQNSRKQSAKLGFLVLRQTLATVQTVVQGKDLTSFVCALPKESVIDVYAEVNVPPAPIKTCTQTGVELTATRIYCICKAAIRLPLQLEDAGRSNAELDALGLPRVDQSTRLDNRVIDLRTSANQGIFRIQSTVCALFREFLLGHGFTEIHSPKMIATASEGGADVFKLTYFDRKAFLAQSPQLYKQMALMGDLERVFEIGPVFRSEKCARSAVPSRHCALPPWMLLLTIACWLAGRSPTAT